MSDAFLREEEDLGRVLDRRLVRRLWPYVAPYRWQMALTVALMVPLFAVEIAPAWIVKTGIDRVIDGEAAAAGAQLPWFEAWLEAPAGISPWLWLGLVYILAMLAGALLQFLQTVLMVTTGQSAMRDLRRDAFAHIQQLHLGFFDRYPVGRLVTRVTNDVENVGEMFAQGIVLLITDVAKMLGFMVALMLLSMKLALLTFIVVPLLATLAVVFRWRIREAFRKVRVRIARINATIQETVTGMKVVQLFTREERNMRDFERQNASHRDAWIESIRYDAALFAAVEFANYLAYAIIIGFGWTLVGVAAMYPFFDWMRRFFLPLRDLSAKFSVMQSAMASSERIFQLLDTEPKIQDRTVTAEADATDRAPAPRAPGEVVFENVWFAYQGEDWVLRDLSFRVAPGERAALVGATGAGKTSVIKLLTRLYEVNRGRILLDGVDIRELPQRELRRRVAMVLQDVFLFSGTVASNIGLGRPAADDAAIEQAARAVAAHPFIARLPNGYQTVLRERGSDLSTGQRQLLSFARAVAHEAQVLVLDEATSAVDPQTELLVQRGLHELLERQTAIVIAHRLSTIQHVDTIHVLHRGCVIESGSHDELMARRGAYHRLYRLQFEEREAVAGRRATA